MYIYTHKLHNTVPSHNMRPRSLQAVALVFAAVGSAKAALEAATPPTTTVGPAIATFTTTIDRIESLPPRWAAAVAGCQPDVLRGGDVGSALSSAARLEGELCEARGRMARELEAELAVLHDAVRRMCNNRGDDVTAWTAARAAADEQVAEPKTTRGEALESTWQARRYHWGAGGHAAGETSRVLNGGKLEGAECYREATTKMDCKEQGLTGTIPSEIGLKTNLITVQLDHNHLSQSIPTQLGGISSLRNLRLNRNFFIAQIPTQIGALSILTNLNLYGNALRGTLCTQLGALTALSALYLSENSLNGPIPSSLGAITRLADLDLKHNLLTDLVPSQLGALTGLTKLELYDNSLEGTLPSTLGALTKLTGLTCSKNRFKGISPRLGSLSNLQVVTLEENPWTCDCNLLWVSSAWKDALKSNGMCNNTGGYEGILVSKLVQAAREPCGYPPFVTATAVSSTSVHLSWDLPPFPRLASLDASTTADLGGCDVTACSAVGNNDDANCTKFGHLCREVGYDIRVSSDNFVVPDIHRRILHFVVDGRWPPSKWTSSPTFNLTNLDKYTNYSISVTRIQQHLRREASSGSHIRETLSIQPLVGGRRGAYARRLPYGRRRGALRVARGR